VGVVTAVVLSPLEVALVRWSRTDTTPEPLDTLVEVLKLFGSRATARKAAARERAAEAEGRRRRASGIVGAPIAHGRRNELGHLP
jgi:hypothetical protein